MLWADRYMRRNLWRHCSGIMDFPVTRLLQTSGPVPENLQDSCWNVGVLYME